MPTYDTPRDIPSPEPNPENEAYFAAAAEGHLLIKRCRSCGEFHHYPRAICPLCFSADTEWVRAQGRGTIYTYSVLRRGAPRPFCLAYVTLAEGITMMTNIVDCDLDGLSIGLPVQVVFRRTRNGIAIPMFTPVGSDQ